MRGWVVKYNNGNVISEWEFDKPFSQLPDRNDIAAVALVYDNKHWVIPGKQHYFSQKSESMVFGIGFQGGRRIEKRTIGYWEDGKKIKITLDENTGEISGPYADGR